MDKSKINQSELDFNIDVATSKVNLNTGRLKCEIPLFTVGANSFQMGVSLLYNSHYKETDFGNKLIGLGNGWKLNIDEYVFPYNVEYNMEGFEEGDYIYIDSSWQIHRFVKYKETYKYGDTREVYYDSNGSGLKLSTGENRYSEIFDGNNNIIRFDLTGRIMEVVSALNPEVVKTITYEEGLIKSIYDSRKPNRKINFNYENNKLIQINVDSYNISYDIVYESEMLSKLTKNNNTKSKDYLYAKYTSNDSLSCVIDAESLSALLFNYNVNDISKVSKVKKGAMKKVSVKEEVDALNYIRDDVHIGDNVYIIGNGIRKTGYVFEMVDEYVKSEVSFSYGDCCTDVTNDKNITYRYFFNENKYTSSILEVDKNNGYNLKTLFKTNGWSLSKGGTSNYSINNNKSVYIGSQDVCQYKVDNLNQFKEIFSNNANSSASKYRYNENFVISFWLMSETGITDDVFAVIEVEDYLKSYLTGYPVQYTAKVLIDKTKARSWQYISIPIWIENPEEEMDEIRIKFNGFVSQPNLYLSDVRIAMGNVSSHFFYDAQTTIDLKEAISFSIIENGVPYSFSFSSDFFLTESDWFSTYKSLYYSNKNNLSEFELTYCNGTKIKTISALSITDEYNDTVSIQIDSNGIPNYYMRSSNRLSNSLWNITENQISFYEDNEDNYYYEIKTSIQNLDTEDTRIEENKCSCIYEIYNANGTIKEKRDEYSVVTAYNYDNYGNLISVTTYNDNDEELTREVLSLIYNYGTIEERLREKPDSITHNGITHKVYYNEPDYSINYTTDDLSRTIYSYDDFKERVVSVNNISEIENKEVLNNSLSYDNYGRLRTITDLSNRTYGFIYNAFGEMVKFFENKKLIQEKKVSKSEDYEIISDLIYNKLITDSTEDKYEAYVTNTKVDKYGRIVCQENEASSVEFIYQDDLEDFNESKSLGKVKKIVDPYENKIYEYIYDDENRPSGYSIIHDNTEYETFVRQIGEGDTEYHFKNETNYLTSKIIKEDTESTDEILKFQNPRIKKTKYIDLDGKNSDVSVENYKEFSYEYEYDSLGRIIKKSSDSIEYDTSLINYPNKINVTKYYEYVPMTTIIKKTFYEAISKDDNGSDSAIIVYDNKYYTKSDGSINGNIEQITESGQRFIENPVDEENIETTELLTRSFDYTYDEFDRLIKEVRKENSITIKETEYSYSSTNDQLNKVIENNIVTKSFTYENGKKIKLITPDSTHNILYDNYGNVINDTVGEITYDSRNLLSCYDFNLINENYTTSVQAQYLYNYQGVRFKKQINQEITGMSSISKIVEYYMDGSRILGEDWKDSNGNVTSSFRYFYDAEGICGIRYDGYNFNFVKDTLGNVTKLMYQGKVIGEYVYDAWGNCEVNTLSTANARDIFILLNNPFRWKSHYFDSETNLYYINGRYYSPLLMQYINADSIENIMGGELSCLDRYAITLDNSITYEENNSTIFTDTELFPDPSYYPLMYKTWWELNWKTAIKLITFGTVLTVSIVLMCNPTTAAFGAGMFEAGTTAALSGSAMEGIIGGIARYKNGGSFIDGFVSGAIDGFINGFMAGAIMYCASQAVTALAKVASSRCVTPSNCFIAGTIVLTKDGNKNIEEIKVGDEVWAYDEDTGKKALKKVVHLFQNKTRKWVHLFFKLENDEKEEIVCTEDHPFYVKNIGWINAINLVANDKILLYNNDIAVLHSKEIEELEKEETTYNFEVEDYHTYYVGENQLLVHNKCVGTYDLEFQSGKHYVGKGNKKRMMKSVRRLQRKYGDIVINKTFIPAANNDAALISEYLIMGKYNYDFSVGNYEGILYNKIHSHGRIIFEIWY